MHVAIEAGNHVLIQRSTRITKEVSDQSLNDVVASLSEIRYLESGIGFEHLLNREDGPRFIEITSDNGVFSMISVINELETEFREVTFFLEFFFF